VSRGVIVGAGILRGLIACAAVALLGAAPAYATSTIVVSQVYGGGGNSGATLKNDFIELYNRGPTAVSLTGWSVQYASTTGTSWQRTSLTGSIPAGGYYLIQEAQGAAGTTDLPTPNATGTIAMSATAGKVILMSNDTAITTGTVCPSVVTGAVDIVGYGSTTNCSETAPTAGLSNTTAALRNGAGAIDTDDNSVDFTVGAPNPRNSGDSAPAVASKSPASGEGNVAVDANVTITFTEDVTVTEGWFSIGCGLSGAHTAVVSGGPTTFTLDPNSDFAPAENCFVAVFADHVSDQDTDDPPDTMTSNHGWGFSTVGPPTRIREIQGSSHTSPLVNTNVSGVVGIVTAKRSNGFYMQDPSPDSDEATSEGILVFTSSSPTAVAVGDSVRVSGRVTEFRPGSASSANLTITELTSPNVAVVSTGVPLPPATVVGTGGRVPPGEVIEDDSTSSVETTGVFDPPTDGIDFYESLEHMRLQVNDAVVVGPRNGFGEVTVVGDDGANAAVRTTRGGLVIRSTDFNPERIQLDDAIVPGSTPAADVGDHFSTAAVGILDYDFGNFELNLTGALTRVPGGLAREATSPQGPKQVAIATFNVENLDPGDGAAKFDELADLIVNHLRSPDLVALEEVQDNNGPEDDGTTDANLTYETLAAAVQAAGGPEYTYRQINPVNDQDGGEPGGNIRVAFFFRTDRGLEFIDRPGGGPTTPTTVVSTPSGPQLSTSPGRIDPTNTAFNSSRKPLVGEFRFRNRKFFVIANHFNSKGGDQPLFGRFQPPTRSSEVQRHRQAQIVNDFVDDILDADPNAHIVALGDFNDFEFSETVDILKGGVLHDMIETLPQSERYSYVFEGNSQSLDHVLVSDATFGLPYEFDEVHVNAEFAQQASDHDPSVLRLALNSPPRGR
jgi:hypothetical protein